MTRSSFDYRDYEMVAKPQSIYHKIFGAKREYEYVVRKAAYRGARGSKLYTIQNLTPKEAKHFLLHDPHGRQLQRDFPTIPLDALVGHLCEASTRPVEKHEVQTMDSDLKVITKSEAAMTALCKHLAASGGAGFTHPEFDEVLGRYAANKFPALRLGNAIAKVLAEETPVAHAYQAVHSFYKTLSGPPPPVADPDEEDEDEEEQEDQDALDALNELAADERRRNPGVSKAVAFAKVYTDPANAKLAARERRQNRPR